MEVVLENPKLLKKSMEVISELVGEGTFVFKKDYLELVALNSNNVLMVIFRLLKTNFEKYSIEKDIKISLSLENFYEVLKSCDESFRLKLIVDEHKLKIISGDREKNTKEFELSLIEFSDENLQQVPKLDFPVSIVTESQVFTKTIGDLSFIEKGILFKAKNKDFSVQGKTNSMSGKIELTDNIDISVSGDKEYESSYSMEYLKKFLKCDRIVKEVGINFGHDYPLKIEYKIIDKLLLTFILAPRGED